MSQPPPLRRGQSIWLTDRDRATRYPALRGRHDTEIAIVGAGMTGAMIAAVFAEAGVRVLVLDASRAGFGSTAASTALLLQEPDYTLAALGRLYGPARAKRLWQLSHATTAAFISNIRHFKVECDLKPRDAIYYTLNRHAELKRDCAQRTRAGFDGELLDQDAMHAITGIDGATGIRTAGNARLNPVRACRGLLAAATRMGARIGEHTEVQRVRRIDEGIRLYSRNATIDAKEVVIATGYATKFFRPLAGRFRMRRTYVLVTEPISSRIRRRMQLDDVMLWDTERPYHYVRWTDDGRLLLGGEDRPVQQGVSRGLQFGNAARQLRDYFDRVLPPLRDVKITGAWEGLFAMTADGLPYIGRHRRYPKHLFALGYGGNGMSFAALASRLLLDHWNGVTNSEQELFAFNRAR